MNFSVSCAEKKLQSSRKLKFQQYDVCMCIYVCRLQMQKYMLRHVMKIYDICMNNVYAYEVHNVNLLVYGGDCSNQYKNTRLVFHIFQIRNVLLKMHGTHSMMFFYSFLDVTFFIISTLCRTHIKEVFDRTLFS